MVALVIVGFCNELVKPVELVQLNDLVAFVTATKFTSTPEHTVTLATVTVGFGFTTTVAVAVAVHPLIVPVTVYTPALVTDKFAVIVVNVPGPDHA